MGYDKVFIVGKDNLCILWKARAIELIVGDVRVLLFPILRKISEHCKVILFQHVFCLLDKIWNIP
jgi:hypothetical protein